MWRNAVTTLPVALLFAAAWLLGGAALLWAGARFVARLPNATFLRALAARLLHGLAAWAILGLGRSAWARLVGAQGHVGFLAAAAITGATIFAFWGVIACVFRARPSEAVLAWTPMAGEVLVLFPLAMLLPELPFWP